MPYTIEPLRKNQAIPSFHELLVPVYRTLSHTPPLEAKEDRPLQMEFEHCGSCLKCGFFPQPNKWDFTVSVLLNILRLK